MLTHCVSGLDIVPKSAAILSAMNLCLLFRRGIDDFHPDTIHYRLVIDMRPLLHQTR